MNEYGLLIAFAFVLAIITLVLWIFLPFAVFGIKERLDRIIRLLERHGS